MKRTAFFLATLVLAATFFAGCGAISKAFDDKIVGSWQQVSVNGTPTILVNVVQFSDNNAYTVSKIGVVTNIGTWSSSGSSYTLTGSFLGFISTTSTITPSFTNSNNTLTYIDQDGYAEVYNRI
jgi:hypothetical protein